MFKDHFSQQAQLYASARPDYPEVLFATLAELSPRRNLAWDTGCGNGQVADPLSRYFRRVYATDPSLAQINQAEDNPNIEYRCEPAESCSLPDRSCGLVTAGQAAHWFHLEGFYSEARRVLVPGGLLAIWCYGLSVVTKPIDKVYHQIYHDVLGPYWPLERRYPESGYRDLWFPYGRLELPSFEMINTWTCDQFLGYLGSWSATGRYIEAIGDSPIAPFAGELRELWGDGPRQVRWPLSVLAAYPGTS